MNESSMRIRVAKDGVLRCAVCCERALRMEQEELRRGDLVEAAFWADRAEAWSRIGFGWAGELAA